MDEYKMVQFNKADFESFKKMYESSKEKGNESFSFGGNEYLTSYAKYLIEYLETKLK